MTNTVTIDEKNIARVDMTIDSKTAKEACQWLYFGYLAAIKTQNGAAMSIGRVCTFLDIYIERDLKNGTLTEKEAQDTKPCCSFFS